MIVYKKTNQNQASKSFKNEKRKWIMHWQMVMLIILTLCLSGCLTAQGQVRVVGESQISKLDNGNYEVTPKWLKDRFDTENSLLKQLQDCQEGRCN